MTSPPSTPLTDRVGFLVSQLGSHAAARFAERLRPLVLRPRHFGLLNLIQAQRAADEYEAELLARLDGPQRRQLVSLLQHLVLQAGLAPGVHPGLENCARDDSQPGRASPRHPPMVSHCDEDGVL